jgi:leucyl/phenylalanyl-tRNA--protein transferase
MVIYRLIKEPVFPHPEESEPDGLLAVGGDLSPERLLTAYSTGIFPWYDDQSPILWWSLDPRLVLFPDDLHVSKKLKRKIRNSCYRVTLDENFEKVIDNCAGKSRPGQNGTWIIPEMKEAYIKLFRLGFAHSIEVWDGNELAGGLYGVSLGRFFSGESMFFLKPDASKFGFSYLVHFLINRDFDFIDCQQPTDHLKSLGAVEVKRDKFLRMLKVSQEHPTMRGKWEFVSGEYDLITQELSK